MTDTRADNLTSIEKERLERVEGVIFNVQRYSVHDGPGVRTNVFLKGCPLHCAWCANPESQIASPQLALQENRCIACGQFETACPLGWPTRENGQVSQESPEEYCKRAAVCPSGAIHWMGERVSAGDVIKEVLRDVPFYQDGGGLTLTGGEPTLQPAMAEALLRLAKAAKISTAIETCGHTSWEILAGLLPHLDLILYDVKHMDSTIHRVHTGVGNERILANLRRLVAVNAPVTVRVPLIPGFNAAEQEIKAIAEFISQLNGSVRGVDLLPYHNFGQGKYKALGRDYSWEKHSRLSKEDIANSVRWMESYGLSVNVGG